MTRLANDILATLPSLRRYAFALTGHRRWGDHYIEIMLEALLENQSWIGPGDDVRFKLYELLHEAMEAVTIGISEPEDESDALLVETRAHSGVLSLPLLERKMILLVLVEGFDLVQAATLVRLPLAEAKSHLDRAVGRLGSRVAMRPSVRHHRQLRFEPGEQARSA